MQSESLRCALCPVVIVIFRNSATVFQSSPVSKHTFTALTTPRSPETALESAGTGMRDANGASWARVISRAFSALACREGDDDRGPTRVTVGGGAVRCRFLRRDSSCGLVECLLSAIALQLHCDEEAMEEWCQSSVDHSLALKVARIGWGSCLPHAVYVMSFEGLMLCGELLANLPRPKQGIGTLVP